MKNFWDKVQQGEVNACWPWIGRTNEKGYGIFSARVLNKRTHRAHRLAYELTNGSIPEGLHVMHLCHNKGCCNPAHLRLGTNEENHIHSAKDGLLQSTNKSGVSGVYWREERRVWEAAAHERGKRVVLYYGRDFDAACSARRTWEASL